jgi:hypothetical protein
MKGCSKISEADRKEVVKKLSLGTEEENKEVPDTPIGGEEQKTTKF